MISTRIRAIELMKLLQPFTQGNILTPLEAENIVQEYISGNKKPIEDLACRPDIPVVFMNATQKLLQFI